jgi:hypothetical protein
MKKTIWVCGIIAGIISVAWGVFGESLSANSLSLNARLFLGYTTMILAFSLIFVAIKNYRDNYNSGIITFGKALQIGLFITLIASTVFVVIWMIDFKYFVHDFGKKYIAQAVTEMKAKGESAAAMKKETAEIAASMEKYNTSPLFRILLTYAEIVPVGLVVSLIAALILKNKSKSVAAAK